MRRVPAGGVSDDGLGEGGAMPPDYDIIDLLNEERGLSQASQEIQPNREDVCARKIHFFIGANWLNYCVNINREIANLTLVRNIFLVRRKKWAGGGRGRSPEAPRVVHFQKVPKSKSTKFLGCFNLI